MISRVFELKPALLGMLCLLGAILLAWYSPSEGVAGLLGSEAREEQTEALKTKIRQRRDEANREVENVKEEYLRKAKRGMTEDEVRWVAEDFLALGLHLEYPTDHTAEGYLALRKKREEWYLGALVSGLMLTEEQEREAREKIGILRHRDYADFIAYLIESAFNHEGREMKVIDGGKAQALMDAKLWLNNEEYLPWKLCQLSAEQLALTSYQRESEDDKEDDKLLDSLVIRPMREVKFDMGESLVVEYDPATAYRLVMTGFLSAGYYLPYSRRQIDALLIQPEDEALEISINSPDSYFFKNFMLLQPEQLKIYFLFRKDVAEILGR